MTIPTHPTPEVSTTTTFACPDVVRDVLAYLLIGLDPWDGLAFRRICNKPTRGIGPVTADAIVDHALRSNIAYYEALMQIAEGGKRRTNARDGLDRLGDCLSWLTFGYFHQHWVTDEFLDMILLDENGGYERFAIGRARSPAAVVSTFQTLRELAAVEKDLMLFMERFPPEWRNLPTQVETSPDA